MIWKMIFNTFEQLYAFKIIMYVYCLTNADITYNSINAFIIYRCLSELTIVILNLWFHVALRRSA